MNGVTTRMRGRPLIMLAFVLLVWVAARVVLWESPFVADAPLLASRSVPDSIGPELAMRAPQLASGIQSEAGSHGGLFREPFVPVPQSWPGYSQIRDENAARQLVMRSDIAGGHQLLWMAAMAHLPIPRELEKRVVVAPLPDRKITPESPHVDRWSVDAWTFWREGSGASAIAQGRVPSYGASQAAAVLQYRLVPQDSRDPRAYARAYRALIDHGESELALGVSARPLNRLPLRTHAEIRLTDRAGDVEARPAVLLTSELTPVALPAQFRAESYAQAGYVGGHGATAFADGQEIHSLHNAKVFRKGQACVLIWNWTRRQRAFQSTIANALPATPNRNLAWQLQFLRAFDISKG